MEATHAHAMDATSDESECHLTMLGASGQAFVWICWTLTGWAVTWSLIGVQGDKVDTMWRTVFFFTTGYAGRRTPLRVHAKV